MVDFRKDTSSLIYEIDSVSAFIAILESLYPDADDMLFRGQREDFPLLPKIARIRLRAGTDLPNVELSMLNEFKLYAPSLVDVVPETDWDWLALAQHYGMATRLLDWTTNPLAALWFTVRRPAVESNRGVVWAFNPSLDDHVSPDSKHSPFSGTHTKVFQPRHIARRIVAQGGWFTVHKYINGKGFVPLERQTHYRGTLTKFVVLAGNFAKIRYGLGQCGVSAASLMADLSGVSSHIQWRHSLLTDEHESPLGKSAIQDKKNKRQGKSRSRFRKKPSLKV